MNDTNRFALTRIPYGSVVHRTTNGQTVTPVADIYETGDAFVVKLDMPGATKESMNVNVQPGSLTIRAAVAPYHRQPLSVLHQEMGSDRFYYRKFHLGNGIDDNAVDAQFHEGVLTVTLPKVESIKTKHISIKEHLRRKGGSDYVSRSLESYS
jgi:HSP20 family molecular chaperone IbpA